MFSKIDKVKQQKIEEMNGKILKAKAEKEKLESIFKDNPELELDMDKSMEIDYKIKGYERFIEKVQASIDNMERHPYTNEELLEVRDEIQKKYNPKLRAAYSEFAKAMDKAIKSFKEYEAIEESLIRDRNILNYKCSVCGTNANIYEGQGIKNSYAEMYSKSIYEIEQTNIQIASSEAIWKVKII